MNQNHYFPLRIEKDNDTFPAEWYHRFVISSFKEQNLPVPTAHMKCASDISSQYLLIPCADVSDSCPVPVYPYTGGKILQSAIDTHTRKESPV